jgi:hypothetical protein
VATEASRDRNLTQLIGFVIRDFRLDCFLRARLGLVLSRSLYMLDSDRVLLGRSPRADTSFSMVL